MCVGVSVCVSVCVCVCVESMSFTPNIVNIHRTILHVLELHLGRAGSKFWFTSLAHHKRGEEEL